MELFSERTRDRNQPLRYDELGEKLQNQLWQYISQTADALIGTDDDAGDHSFWKVIGNVILQEHGIGELPRDFAYTTTRWKIMTYFKGEISLKYKLDILELSIKIFPELGRNKEDISKIRRVLHQNFNTLFKRNNFGYEFIDGQIVRIDHKKLHAGIVDKTLDLLTDKLFHSANQEFKEALDHHKYENYKDAVTAANRAFESTMKIALSELYKVNTDKMVASQLIQKLVDNGAFPSFLTTQLGTLSQFMTSSVPTIRNKTGGHGKGKSDLSADKELSTLCIYQSGSLINYIYERYKQLVT